MERAGGTAGRAEPAPAREGLKQELGLCAGLISLSPFCLSVALGALPLSAPCCSDPCKAKEKAASPFPLHFTNRCLLFCLTNCRVFALEVLKHPAKFPLC